MVSFWRTPTLLREMLAALFCALTLLAGVVQARAGTEFAAKSGFASTLTLCQQAGSGGSGPEPDANCDHCRMPGTLGLGVQLFVAPCLRMAQVEKAAPAKQTIFVALRTILPEPRGPPNRA